MDECPYMNPSPSLVSLYVAQDLLKKNHFVDWNLKHKKNKKIKKTTLWTLEFQAFLTHTIYLYGSLEPTSPGGS